MQKDIQTVIQGELEQQKIFHSPSLGRLTFKEVIYRIGLFMHDNPHLPYEVILGSDSQVYADRVDFVSAIIIHRLGGGAIYFWQRQRETQKKYYLRDRVYQEALFSMDLAQNFMEQFKIEGIIKFNLEIHVDIGKQGRTKELIQEVVGMVRGNGFVVKTKPHAYGAATVADRYT